MGEVGTRLADELLPPRYGQMLVRRRWLREKGSGGVDHCRTNKQDWETGMHVLLAENKLLCIFESKPATQDVFSGSTETK
jgi:hypothetical protein